MLFIEPKLTIKHTLDLAKGFLGMMHRRHFVVATIPLAALTLFVPTDGALAQTPGKAEVKISELRPVVRKYVDHLSQEYKTHTGIEFSQEEQGQMVEEIIDKMKARGFYAYVDP